MVINKGKIINTERERTCFILGWCPYNSIIWSFKFVKEDSKYNCSIFSRHCPVFYISEDITENSPEVQKK